MQQLIITLIALLGMIVPVANSRTIKFFNRMVPQMTVVGRLATQPRLSDESVAVGAKFPSRIIQALFAAVQRGLCQPARNRPDPQLRRVRRVQRAAGWRRALNDQIRPLLHARVFFCSAGPRRWRRVPGWD